VKENQKEDDKTDGCTPWYTNIKGGSYEGKRT